MFTYTETIFPPLPINRSSTHSLTDTKSLTHLYEPIHSFPLFVNNHLLTYSINRTVNQSLIPSLPPSITHSLTHLINQSINISKTQTDLLNFVSPSFTSWVPSFPPFPSLTTHSFPQVDLQPPSCSYSLLMMIPRHAAPLLIKEVRKKVDLSPKTFPFGIFFILDYKKVTQLKLQRPCKNSRGRAQRNLRIYRDNTEDPWKNSY